LPTEYSVAGLVIAIYIKNKHIHFHSTLLNRNTMSIIFAILMSLGIISNPVNTNVKHDGINQQKFDYTYSSNTRGGLDWEVTH